MAGALAQNSTLLVVNEGKMFRWDQAIICCVIGLLAGFTAGLINLGFVKFSDEAAVSFIGGVVAWTVLGGAIGFAMVFVILNFKPSRAIVGGLIGGIGVASSAWRPELSLIGVEPRGAASMAHAWSQGGPARLDGVASCAKSLAAAIVGEQGGRAQRHQHQRNEQARDQ